MVSIYERHWKTSKGESKTAYRVAYTVDGKQRQKQFRTRRLASIFVSRLEGVINTERAQAAAQASLTLDQLFRQFIAARKIGADGNPPLEPQSIYQYEMEYRTRIGPLLGDRRVREITLRDVREFLNELTNTDLRRTTQKKILGTLRTVFAYGLRIEEIAHNPASSVRIKSDRRREGFVVTYSKAEMRQIIQVARDLALSYHGQRQKTWIAGTALLHCLVYGGLRVGEARALRRDSFDRAHARIKIDQRADRRGRIGRPKSRRSNREVVVPDVVIEWLDRAMNLHARPLIFSTKGGRPWDETNLARHFWYPLLRAAGVPRLRLYSCRHFYASLMIDQGVNPKQLSQDMGHHSEAFTMSVYGHLFKDPETERRNRVLKNAAVL